MRGQHPRTGLATGRAPRLLTLAEAPALRDRATLCPEPLAAAELGQAGLEQPVLNLLGGTCDLDEDEETEQSEASDNNFEGHQRDRCQQPALISPAAPNTHPDTDRWHVQMEELLPPSPRVGVPHPTGRRCGDEDRTKQGGEISSSCLGVLPSLGRCSATTTSRTSRGDLAAPGA